MSAKIWTWAIMAGSDPAEMRDHFRCKRCGVRQVVELPADVAEFAAQSKAFVAAHRECGIREARPE